MKKSSTDQQSPHWVDQVVDNILSWQKDQRIEKLHVDDMKTPSGRVHVGALRGVVLHDLVARVLRHKSQHDVTYTYVFNDMDSMDGLPTYLPEQKFAPLMGTSLHKIPAPELTESGIGQVDNQKEQKALIEAQTMAQLYAIDFIFAFNYLGCRPEIVWSHQLYESGQMDDAIRQALDHVADLKKIYKEVAEYQLPDQWYPFQPICQNCGKTGTTLTTGWDGKLVTYRCLPDKVGWAVGCGHQGQVSPFGGTGKLLWKVDWPAHWAVMGVNIEGAGKDHTSSGGSRDMANAICQKVFGIPVPFDIPYEWILLRGAKMSSSKGVGTSAREFVELFPPEVGRFLFVNKHYNQVIDFDPATMAIPDLFDEYDLGAKIYWGKEKGDVRIGRSFELAQINSTPQAHFLPRFRDVALWMQYPELDLSDKFAQIKGSVLTSQEEEVLQERVKFAQIWVERYAPAEYQFTPQPKLPQNAQDLTPDQIIYLNQVVQLLTETSGQKPADLQQKLFDLAKTALGPKAGFQAIYLLLLGKTAGPRAGWLLQSVGEEFVKNRLVQLTQVQNAGGKTNIQPDDQKSHLQIQTEVKQKFPGIFFAQVRIDNVTIKAQDPQLETLTQATLKKLEGLTPDDLKNYPSILAYRELLRATKTDFHKNRPSPEALLRRVIMKKGLYQINTAVDAYNIAVIETGIGLGGFDADLIQPPVILRFSKEGESMLLLGDKEATLTRLNQLIYADQKRPITIDLNYRDIDATKITTQTKNILLFADGAPGLSEAEVTSALKKGAEYIKKFCGGTIGEIEVIK